MNENLRNTFPVFRNKNPLDKSRELLGIPTPPFSSEDNYKITLIDQDNCEIILYRTIITIPVSPMITFINGYFSLTQVLSNISNLSLSTNYTSNFSFYTATIGALDKSSSSVFYGDYPNFIRNLYIPYSLFSKFIQDLSLGYIYIDTLVYIKKRIEETKILERGEINKIIYNRLLKDPDYLFKDRILTEDNPEVIKEKFIKFYEEKKESSNNRLFIGNFFN